MAQGRAVLVVATDVFACLCAYRIADVRMIPWGLYGSKEQPILEEHGRAISSNGCQKALW